MNGMISPDDQVILAILYILSKNGFYFRRTESGTVMSTVEVGAPRADCRTRFRKDWNRRQSADLYVRVLPEMGWATVRGKCYRASDGLEWTAGSGRDDTVIRSRGQEAEETGKRFRL